MKKRLAAWLLALVMALSLAGCGRDTSTVAVFPSQDAQQQDTLPDDDGTVSDLPDDGDDSGTDAIDEDGSYTSKEEVALYIHTYGRLPGNFSMCFEGVEGESLLLLLDDKGICASSGSACTSGSLDPSHVLLAIGRIPETAHGSLRLSIDETLSEKEADYIVESVKEVVEYLRNMSPLWHDKVEGRREFYL